MYAYLAIIVRLTEMSNMAKYDILFMKNIDA